jgi:4-aminobutyrate aminotransferase/(S)-3-amino-2-methylpropionate transaminase
MDEIHPSGLGGTYGGNPIACAAALGAIETIQSQNLIKRANELGKIMVDALNAMKAKYPVIGEVRGRGAMIAIELVKPGSKEPNGDVLGKVVKYAQQKGVLFLTAGTYGNVLRFLPPLVISDDLVKDAMSILDEAFANVN